MRAWSLALLVALGACAPEGELRLGAEGERCFSDLDCRPALVCALERCAPPQEDAPGDPNNEVSNNDDFNNDDFNNALNNGVSNNGVSNNGVGNNGQEALIPRPACDPVQSLGCVCANEAGVACEPFTPSCRCFESGVGPTPITCASLCGGLEGRCNLPQDLCFPVCEGSLEALAPLEQWDAARCIEALDCGQIQGGAAACLPEPPARRLQTCDTVSFVINEVLRCPAEVYEPCLRGASRFAAPRFYMIRECALEPDCGAISSCLEEWR